MKLKKTFNIFVILKMLIFTFLLTSIQASTFTLNTTISPANTGSVTLTPNKSVYDSGEVVTLAVSPQDGYSFLGWSEESEGNEVSIDVVMDSNKSITAYFNPLPLCSLITIVNLPEHGTITKNPDKPLYYVGEVVRVSITPSGSGGPFIKWTGDASGDEDFVDVVMDYNKTIVANFIPTPTYSLQLNINYPTECYLRLYPEKGLYDSGEVVTIVPTAEWGWTLTSWGGDASGDDKPLIVVMDTNKNINAIFEQLRGDFDRIGNDPDDTEIQNVYNVTEANYHYPIFHNYNKPWHLRYLEEWPTNIAAEPFVMEIDGFITSISMYHGPGFAGEKICYGIYDGDYNSPKNLLAKTYVRDMAPNEGWQAIQIMDGGINIPKGKKIWLAWHYSDRMGKTIRYCSQGSLSPQLNNSPPSISTNNHLANDLYEKWNRAGGRYNRHYPIYASFSKPQSFIGQFGYTLGPLVPHEINGQTIQVPQYLGVRMTKNLIKQFFLAEATKPIADVTKYHKNIVDNIQWGHIDQGGNKIIFYAKGYTARYSYGSWTGRQYRDYYVNLDITGAISPEISIENGKVKFQLVSSIEETEITDYGGWYLWAAGGATVVIIPFINTFLPTIAPMLNEILICANTTIGTSSFFLKNIIQRFVDAQLANNPDANTVIELESFANVMTLLEDANTYGFSNPRVEMSSSSQMPGMWLYLDIAPEKWSNVQTDIVDKLNELLTGDVYTYLDEIQDWAFEVMGRYLTPSELQYYGQFISNGIDYIKDKIARHADALRLKYMKGFDLSKFNDTQDKLIISMGGGGVYLNSNNINKKPFETIAFGDAPSTLNHYGDEIYQLASEYPNEKSIAVISYPFIVGDQPVDISDEFWDPTPEAFAEKIKAALAKMAPESKLILIGKSLGACILEKVVDELKTDNIPVELLVLVDASCTFTDQSSQVVPINTNVKKVYNFRQISTLGNNDGQNGYSISWNSPTFGKDKIISGVGQTGYPNPSYICEGVGHDDIDECESLLEEINRLIGHGLGKGDITPILNLLLLD